MSSNNPHDRESDGGPAFPIQCHDRVKDWEGMSLRDWFAGQALQGLLANKRVNNESSQLLAEASYELSDYMLKERAK